MISNAFVTELELVESFIMHAFTLFPRMLIAAREVKGTDGIADVVLARPRSIRHYACALIDDGGDLCAGECEFHSGPYRTGLQSSPFDDIVAIEAKLQDWTRGVYQASRYRQFAHRTYVLVGGDGVHRAVRNRKIFERSGVGLIAQYPTGFKAIVSSPREQPSVEVSRAFVRSQKVNPHLFNAELLLDPFAPFPEMRECPRWSDYFSAAILRGA